MEWFVFAAAVFLFTAAVIRDWLYLFLLFAFLSLSGLGLLVTELSPPWWVRTP